MRGLIRSLVALFLSSRAALAQATPPAKETIAVGDFQLSPLLQVRARGEYWRDPVDIGGRTVTYGSLGVLGAHVTDALAFSTRARLGLGVERGPIKAVVTLQDARVWGATPPTAILEPNRTAFGATGAYEAYLEIHTTGPQRPTFLRVGRQAIEWGDGRLLGNADFSPTARSLDAARARVALGAWDFEALASFIDTPRPLGVAFGDANAQTTTWGAQLYGARAEWTLDPLLAIEAIGLARVVSEKNALPADGSLFSIARSQGETYTGSLRVHGDAKGWVYSVMGAIQGGTTLIPTEGVPGTRTRERLAGAVAGSIGKTFDGIVWSPTVTALGAFATGDTGSGTYNQFDPILPNVHQHYGLMNVFALSNIFTPGGRLGVLPFQNGRLSAEYRYAMLADSHGEWLNGYLLAVSGPRANNLRDLGHEVDVTFGWRPHPALDLAAGYGIFLLTGDASRAALRAERRGDVQSDGSITPANASHYAYVQATVNMP